MLNGRTATLTTGRAGPPVTSSQNLPFCCKWEALDELGAGAGPAHGPGGGRDRGGGSPQPPDFVGFNPSGERYSAASAGGNECARGRAAGREGRSGSARAGGGGHRRRALLLASRDGHDRAG